MDQRVRKRLSGKLFIAKKPTALAARESDISASIADYLNARSIYNVRINSGRIKTSNGSWVHMAPKGTPDRFALYKGVLLAIEVKRPGETPTKEQIEAHEQIEQAGGVVVVAQSIDEVVMALKRIDEQERQKSKAQLKL